MKKINEHLAAVEALLFVSGDEGISIEEFKKLLNIPSDQIVALLETLKLTYNDDITSGLTLIETARKFKLVTKQEYAKLIEKYAQSSYSKHLTPAMMETLAIIAYKQPITRMEIEEIRGVQVSGNLKKLAIRDLIEEAGRLEQPGRPLLYKTTPTFLDYFGLNSIEELPALDESQQSMTTNLFFDPLGEGKKESEEG